MLLSGGYYITTFLYRYTQHTKALHISEIECTKRKDEHKEPVGMLVLITHSSDSYKWRNKADCGNIPHLQLPLNLFGCLLHYACYLYPPRPHGLQNKDKKFLYQR